MAADKIALTETYDANKNLITHCDLIDWQKAIREAFYLNVFQSCVIEANISAMSFEEATDLLQNGKLNAAVIDDADAKKKEKEASVLAGLAKAYAFMLKALNSSRSMTIDLPVSFNKLSLITQTVWRILRTRTCGPKFAERNLWTEICGPKLADQKKFKK